MLSNKDTYMGKTEKKIDEIALKNDRNWSTFTLLSIIVLMGTNFIMQVIRSTIIHESFETINTKQSQNSQDFVCHTF